MDWVNQNKLRNWLIIILAISNLLTISMIWMQASKKNEPLPKGQDLRPAESANLVQKALDLDKGQSEQYDKIRAEQRELSKTANDRLATLKRQLADILFTNHPDTALAHSTANQIGELQSKVEMIRFDHFNELLALCTPAQKEKLKPIVLELFGRKPPRDEQGLKNQQYDRKEAPPRRDTLAGGPKRDGAQPPRENRPDRPSVDDRLARYSERLSLSDEQAQKIRAVLMQSKLKDEQLRKRVNPDPREIQDEKDRIRKAEEDGIMKILNENQKREFLNMISKRGK